MSEDDDIIDDLQIQIDELSEQVASLVAELAKAMQALSTIEATASTWNK